MIKNKEDNSMAIENNRNDMGDGCGYNSYRKKYRNRYDYGEIYNYLDRSRSRDRLLKFMILFMSLNVAVAAVLVFVIIK